MKVGVSACLTGQRCRYDGQSRRSQAVMDFLADKDWVPVCPEMEGGLPCPRPACELQGTRVRTRDGQDFTAEYEAGAAACLEKVKDCSLVILQPRSPSCGLRQVHDGSFSGTLRPGSGLFASRLTEAGIPVVEADAF